MNNLVINAKKSNSMVIPKNKLTDRNNSFSITINNDSIENVNEALYLGMTIDDRLSWTSHVNKLCKSIGYNIKKLKYLRKFSNKEMLCSIYNASIQPIIDYGITIWSMGGKKHIDRIQRLQNHCARIILNNYDFLTTRGIDLVKQLRWMTVQERADYFRVLMVFKSLNGMCPQYLQNEFNLRRDLNLRTSTDTEFNVYIPPFESSIKDKSFCVRGAQSWNNLPLYLKQINSLHAFKREYKKYFKL